jgi:hypothetical protein
VRERNTRIINAGSRKVTSGRRHTCGAAQGNEEGKEKGQGEKKAGGAEEDKKRMRRRRRRRRMRKKMRRKRRRS